MKFSIKHHIIFWIVYLIWEVSQGVGGYLMAGSPLKFEMVKIFFYSATLTTIIKIALAYFLLFIVLIPEISGKRKQVVTILLTFFSILIAVFIYRIVGFYYILPHLYEYDMSKRMFFTPIAIVNAMLDTLTPVFALIIYELFRYTRKTRENAIKLEKEKLKSELSFLKAQINPHFLFNVLSTIHALARNESPQAANVAVKLSNIMRFMLYEASNKKITIKEEVMILEDYIDLERTRFKNKLNVEFVKDISDHSKMIAPLLLLPFVENAFKHGTGESLLNSFIKINLDVNDSRLLFTVENSLESMAVHSESSGIGLRNVKRRLELLYPLHELEIQSNNSGFSVILKINLLENEQPVLPGN